MNETNILEEFQLRIRVHITNGPWKVGQRQLISPRWSSRLAIASFADLPLNDIDQGAQSFIGGQACLT